MTVGLLGLAGCDSGTAPAEQARPKAQAAATPAAAAGKVDRSHAGERPPAAIFAAPDGESVRLADFAGRPLLVNLWATWCGPCVAELPTLDRLAGEGRVRVLAVSQDLDARAKVTAFLRARKVSRLAPYHDPKLGLSVAYAANLPLTILYDARGREVWRVAGAMDWTGAEARRLLREA